MATHSCNFSNFAERYPLLIHQQEYPLPSITTFTQHKLLFEEGEMMLLRRVSNPRSRNIGYSDSGALPGPKRSAPSPLTAEIKKGPSSLQL
ncbi:unnamed protein product [Nezara viridula]|uniref:Uncharacterized protein n=1 Tax=Nezara viridula TaxID=85310 RepID=A0A9P0HPM4_NEZVI|nr:unnamed protein product [Nezara viridula]